MILNVSSSTGDAMLNAVANILEGAHLELLTDDGELLVTLGLFDPGPAVDGELTFKVADGTAVMTGEAQFARAVAADGSEVFSYDVGDKNSNAVIKLNTTNIDRDGPVSLSSFRLIMP